MYNKSKEVVALRNCIFWKEALRLRMDYLYVISLELHHIHHHHDVQKLKMKCSNYTIKYIASRMCALTLFKELFAK